VARAPIILTAAFTDAINQDWGGKPIVDLQKGWKYALEKYPEIDTERTTAAGASYGGYAIKCVMSLPLPVARVSALSSFGQLDTRPSRVRVWIQGTDLP
jgi:Prolyl oligopeptidase family